MVLRSNPAGTRSVCVVPSAPFPGERAGVKVPGGAAAIAPHAQPMHGRLLHVVEMHLCDHAAGELQRDFGPVVAGRGLQAGHAADRGLHVLAPAPNSQYI